MSDTQNTGEQHEKPEQINLLENFSGVPFYMGPFNTKKGPSKPLRGNLYLTATMRRVFLSDEASNKENKVVINGREFQVRQARHAADGGRLRNIIHPADAIDIKEFLKQKLEGGTEKEGEELVHFHTGEFNTKKGPRFPEGRTIYATAELRKMLGIEGITGEVVIEGQKFKVRQARKAAGGEQKDFVNIVHPVDRALIQEFLRKQNEELEKARKEASDRAGAIEE